MKMIRHMDLQAVVLAAGKGSRMTELTSGKPKCLLPIGNMPMVWYPLKLLEDSGFHQAIVIILETAKVEFHAAIEELNLKIELDVVAIPDAEEIGTADSLRHIHDKITKDCLIISSDLIANIDISDTINLYRKHSASITALFLQTLKTPEDFIAPGPKSKQKPERDLIGIDNKTGRLVFLASASDFEDKLSIPSKLLKKHSDFTVHTKLLDAHLYIVKKWVIDFLIHHKNFNTLKGELLPYIVKKQLNKPKKVEEKNTSLVKVDLKKDIFRFAVEESLDTLIRDMSGFNDHFTDLDDAYHGNLIRCYAHIYSEKSGLRANTLQMYSLANSLVTEWYALKNEGIIQGSSVSPKATVKSTQVQNCRINENAFISEKTSLKNSFIGHNVVVEPKTRILKSILMGNVKIKEKCVIENCILCDGCTIESETELKDCLVGAHHTIPSGSCHSREVLTDIDALMEI